MEQALRHLQTAFTHFFARRAGYPNERRDRTRLARAQRHLARKAPGEGANRARARRKVARIHARVADRRRDTLHKITTRLVRENQTIVIEGLTVRNPLKNGKLARAISDAAWSEFRSLPEYKAQRYGREVIAARNILAAGPAVSACGTGVGPQRSTPGGQSATKQGTPRREP